MTTRARDPFAPLPRTWLDTSMPIVRALIGAAFVAFSSYATIFLFADDIQSIFHERTTIGPFADRYWYGMLAAVIFFLGEIYTAEKWPRAYRAVLVPDTIYTARQMYPGFAAVLSVLALDFSGMLFVLALAIGSAVLIAYGAGWALRWWLLIWAVAGGIIIFTGWAWSLEIARLILAILMAAYSGYIVARFGEVFLFGKRRGKEK